MRNETAQQPPVVSVLMLTYNHARFIAQAIESVLTQRAPFAFELVIGDDASTDGTRAIVEDYARRFPAVIRALLHPRNLGMAENTRAVTNAARGRFVAHVEGDDYWTHPDKLRRQVEFLDAHPECPACFHDAAIVDGAGNEIAPPFCTPKPAPYVDLGTLLAWNRIPTPSKLYRRAVAPEFPDSIYRLAMQDWPMTLLVARHGPWGFIDEKWAAYRMHSGATWSTKPAAVRWRQIIEFYAAMVGMLEPHYGAELKAATKAARLNLVAALGTEGNRRAARAAAWRYWTSAPHRFRLPPNRREFLRRLVG